MTAIEIGKSYQTRLPNVTLPGPADGVPFSLANLGIPIENILDDDKDFDAARVKVSGGKVTIFPKTAGDHKLTFPIQTKQGDHYFTTTFLLTVNPDPKTLWKDVPVPEGTPFAKPDRDSFHYDDGAIRIVAASQRGRTHAQQGTCRDDDMAFWSDPATGRYVLVVADGAGSAKFSRQGSKIAVDTAIRELSEKLTDAVWASDAGDLQPYGNVGKVLVATARAAVGAIDAFAKQNPAAIQPAPALKDFNTTLLMAAVKRIPDGSLLGATFSIGDGAIAWWQPEKAKLLCAPDGGEFSGQTKFLTTLSVWKDAGSDYAAFQKARCFTFRKTPEEAVAGRLFLMTDGVSDPFFETDNLLRNPAEWDKFATEQMSPLNLFVQSGGDEADSASNRLLDWLSFWSVGNHDDRTIAVLGASPQP